MKKTCLLLTLAMTLTSCSDALKKENAEVHQQNNRLTEEKAKVEADLIRKAAEVSSLTERLAEQKTRLDELSKSLADEREATSKLKIQIAELIERNKSAEEKTNELKSELDKREHANNAASAGNVKGTVTYFFNSNYGNRPDTGAKVWLVTEDSARKAATAMGGTLAEPVPSDWDLFDHPSLGLHGYNGYKGGNPVDATFEVVSKALADGNGSFFFEKVPVGSYLIILQSNHTKGSGFVGRDGRRKVRFVSITVKEGQSADASFDFGVSEGALYVPAN